MVYNELLRDMQAQDGLNVRLDAPAGVHVALLFADSAKDGGWSSDQVKMIERLRPHIRQFSSVRHALVEAGALGASLYGLLDNTETCVIQLDRFGRIVAANDVAGGMLRRRDASIAPGGFLRATGMEENVELQRLLARAIPPFGSHGTGGSMTLRGSSHFKVWTIHMQSRTGGVDGRSYTPRLRTPAGGVPGDAGLDRSGSRGVGPWPHEHGKPVGRNVGRRAQREQNRCGHGSEARHRSLAPQPDLPEAGHRPAGRTGAPGVVAATPQ